MIVRSLYQYTTGEGQDILWGACLTLKNRMEAERNVSPLAVWGEHTITDWVKAATS